MVLKTMLLSRIGFISLRLRLIVSVILEDSSAIDNEIDEEVEHIVYVSDLW